jgi:hypothetical protein
MRKLVLFAGLVLPAALAAADWGPVGFLVGRWTGEGGGGDPGTGSGAFTLAPELQGKILVRRNFAAYPAAEGRPAFRHDDLMVVYRDQESAELRATYWDSEGHVIAYTVQPAAEGGVVFLSEAAPSRIRYRLTYLPAGKDKIKIRFEIAPPGKDFAIYLEAAAHRD